MGSVKWGLLIHDDDIFCPQNGSTAIPNYLTEVTNVLRDHMYSGIILPLDCEICSASTPCDFMEGESGTLLKFGTDLNTYYDLDCADDDGLPVGIIRNCEANTDYGAEAYLTLTTIVDEEKDFEAFTLALMAELSKPYVYFPRMYRTTSQTPATRRVITRAPTREPTITPTITPTAPTSAPTSNPDGLRIGAFCEDYVNKVSDLIYLGGGAS